MQESFPGDGEAMASKKAERLLKEKKQWLEGQLADSKKQTDGMWSKIERAPRETFEVGTLEFVDGKPVEGKQKVITATADQRLLRDYYDTMRAQGLLEHQIREIEFLLSIPKGREPEPIYQQAQRDREANPQLTVHQLAEKYFPHYFPGRADSATRMMDQGLRRLVRKNTTATNKK
jgi:hypothetical protein